MTGRSRMTSVAVVILTLCTLVAAMVGSVLAAPHLALLSSAPAAGSVLDATPASIELRFSAPVTAVFCRVTLARPDSSTGLALPIAIVRDSTVSASVVSAGAIQNGHWVVHWQAAGADGHAITGQFAFELRSSQSGSTAALPNAVAQRVPPVSQIPTIEELGVARVFMGRLARLAVYAAFFIAIGAIGTSMLVVPRLRRTSSGPDMIYPTVLDGMALSVGVVAGFMLVLSMLIRTVQQFGDARSMTPGLSITGFLTDTAIGRGLAIATLLGAVIALASAAARNAQTGSALWRTVQITCVVVFLYFWASLGHSAAAPNVAGIPADFALVAHVLAAGLWIGTLLVIFVTVLPLALRDPSRMPLLRATILAFSPVALVSAGFVGLSGVLNSLAQLGSVDLLFTTTYGKTLLAKIAVVIALLCVGAWNWRVVRPRLGDTSSALTLRSTVRLELLIAAVVLVITSILVATIPPHWLPGGR